MSCTPASLYCGQGWQGGFHFDDVDFDDNDDGFDDDIDDIDDDDDDDLTLRIDFGGRIRDKA